MIELRSVEENVKCIQCTKRKAVIALRVDIETLAVKIPLCITCLARLSRNLSQCLCEIIERKSNGKYIT